MENGDLVCDVDEVSDDTCMYLDVEEWSPASVPQPPHGDDANDNFLDDARSALAQLETFSEVYGSPGLLLFALTIPGILHIIHNLLKEVTGHMIHFKAFYTDLQQIDLLWHGGRKQRFIKYCVLESRFRNMAQESERTWFGNLYE